MDLDNAEAEEGAPDRPLPLSGLTVLDLGQIYNGPYAGFLMAMAGAAVIKIEPPEGEKMRRRSRVGGAMLPFAMLNSNKKFVTLDLKSELGKSVFLEMVDKADVVVENFAPGVMERLGLGPDTLLDRNPRLVYAAGSGYGWSGPYRDLLAMDLTVQAMSGVIACTGHPDRPPVKAGPAICDFFGGVHLYSAAVTALVERERTGRGRFVEASMLESVFPALSSTLGLYHGLGNVNPPRTGNRHGGMAEAPYNVYPASDGWVAMICVSDTHFRSLAKAMDRPDLLTDPRYDDLKARVDNMDSLDESISAWSRGLTKVDLAAALANARIPAAIVREIDEVVNDPHMHARGTLRHVDHPAMGRVTLPTGPLRFEGSGPIDLQPSKDIGADNRAVFADWLGLNPKQLRTLLDTEVA